MDAFGNFYRGKTVLVTGHTGFKGSWLATWLDHLGARVVGYALDPPTRPANFEASRLARRIHHVVGDVRDTVRLRATFAEARPDVVLHLAAQALVREAYRRARETFEVNLMGTVNVLEAALATPSVRAVVLATSDKCYFNQEWPWGYRETDRLGGEDPYSASKACAELAIAVYAGDAFQRMGQGGRDLAIASGRAGNVIGGGDWAADRVVPDLVRAITARRDLVLRKPSATRPWQHVLVPLSGYLCLASQLATRPELRTSWNFGPADGAPRTVQEVVGTILQRWGPTATRLVVEQEATPHEATLLKLDCSKALQLLEWRAAWDVEATLEAVVQWYRRYHESGEEQDMHPLSVDQIEQFTRDARARGIRWALPAD